MHAINHSLPVPECALPPGPSTSPLSSKPQPQLRGTLSPISGKSTLMDILAQRSVGASAASRVQGRVEINGRPCGSNGGGASSHPSGRHPMTRQEFMRLTAYVPQASERGGRRGRREGERRQSDLGHPIVGGWGPGGCA
jgi:hypothetical protein